MLLMVNLVDAHVGRALFHGAIGPLTQEGKTVILVTHSMHILPYCHRVYSMEGGIIYPLHINSPPLPLQVLGEGETLSNNVEAQTDAMPGSNAQQRGAGTGKDGGKLIKLEKRSTGSVPWSGMGLPKCFIPDI